MTRNNTNFPIRPLRNTFGISATIVPVIYLIISALNFLAFIMMTGLVELFIWFMFNLFGDWSKENGH